MGLLSDIFETVVTGIGSALRVAVDLAQVATARIKAAYGALQEQIRAGKAAPPDSERTALTGELRDVNQELLRLLDKYRERGSLSASESQRSHYLKQRREEIKTQLQASDEYKASGDIAKHGSDYKGLIVADDTTHILQYHVGQTTFGKKCPRPGCGREMVLQWRRDLQVVRVNDFGWGCSGYYHVFNGHRACEVWLDLEPDDLSLFTKTTRPDFELPAKEFSKMVLGHETLVRQRVDAILHDPAQRREGVESHRCPVHFEPLVLREKRDQVSGLLDRYFLGCPRWLPDAKGCGYLVKLKSAAQLSSLLEAQSGRGII